MKSDFALNESVQFIPTPGHTIDHYSVLVGRPGQDALITGDMIHSPIQGRYPELGMRADYDSPQAGRNAAQGVRPVLRRAHDDVRDAFPLALDRARAPLGRRLQIRGMSRAGHNPDAAISKSCRAAPDAHCGASIVASARCRSLSISAWV